MIHVALDVACRAVAPDETADVVGLGIPPGGKGPKVSGAVVAPAGDGGIVAAGYVAVMGCSLRRNAFFLVSY